jgi:hypothetical protein
MCIFNVVLYYCWPGTGDSKSGTVKVWLNANAAQYNEATHTSEPSMTLPTLIPDPRLTYLAFHPP